MKKYIALLVSGLFLIMFVGYVQTVAADEHLILQGKITLNTDPAPKGVTVNAIIEGTTEECGSATTEDDGVYRLVVINVCDEGLLKFQLVATKHTAVTKVSILSEDSHRDIEIAFENLSSEAIDAIMGGTASAEAPEELIEALQGVIPPPEEALIKESELFNLLMIVVGGGLGLLAVMVFVRWWIDLQRVDLGRKIVIAIEKGENADEQQTKDGNGQGRIPALLQVLSVDTDGGSYRRQIEGMVMVLVVVAVILLGVKEKIGEEGLVSVLAAIAGYAVGRATST